MTHSTQEPLAQTESPDRRRSMPGEIFVAIVLVSLSALGFAASFPDFSWSGLAWVALMPLLLLARWRIPGRVTYPIAYLGGVLFWLICLRWVPSADPSVRIGWFLMASVLAPEWPVAIAVIRTLTREVKLPLIVAAPLVWVGLEHARGFYLTGFPWYRLAHSQYELLPLVQLSDLTGELGVSLLIVAINALGVELVLGLLPNARKKTVDSSQTQTRGLREIWPILRWSLSRWILVGSPVLGIALAWAYGGYRLAEVEFEPGPRVALLQSDLAEQIDSRRDPNQTLAHYRTLMVQAMDQLDPGQELDLVIWPETSYPYTYLYADASLRGTDLASAVAEFDPAGTLDEWNLRRETVVKQLDQIVRFLSRQRDPQDDRGVPTLIAAISRHLTPTGTLRRNSALLIEAGQPVTQFYHKMHLVPFGEYVPLLETFPILEALTPYPEGGAPNLDHGLVPQILELGSWKLAVAICFEDTIARVVRRTMSQVDQDGRRPDLIVNLSNDGWFRGTSEQSMHLAIASFRAVEHRRPMVRAVNTGISALIDSNGRIVHQLAPATAGALIVQVPIDRRETLYPWLGDWPGSLSLVTLAAVLLTLYLGRALRTLVRQYSPNRTSLSSST